MALIIKNFELPDKFVLSEAYLRVNAITTSKIDYEFLKPMGNSEDLIVEWLSRFETKVVIYIHGDKVARKNQVAPLHWFQFDLDYDLSEHSNIYEQAYKKLKVLYPEGEDD